ncbi:MAG: threonine--tRNA ligase [Deferribacteraceae bacterium]|jgi:threonyl-tRNA synthetase|nr:threonine--tRNA ligase [Deferribacteraceae bacterium]
MLSIKLPDGKAIELQDKADGRELAAKISNSLVKKAVAIEVNGVLRDLSTELHDGETVKIVTDSEPIALEILRHSTAHLMAQAVQTIFPEAKVTIGPVIDDGFYYDFDYKGTFAPEDLLKIEKEMARLAGANEAIVRSEVSAKDAIAKFSAMGENFKVEIIEDLGAETVSLYSQGAFTDLCRGPHLPATGKIKNFKLLSVAGAYWRGDEKNPQLQRIYGTAFYKKEELDAYLTMLEEAKKRDHRKLGRQLGLFMFDDEIGAGFPMYLPRGGMLRAVLEQFEREEHIKRGYDIVYGPTLLKTDMWKRSGHYEHYRENMYFTEVDGVSFGVKPMNCINHIMMYASELRSYRDLPVRMFELGNVHRHEKSGALHGLLRVRAFTQDDAHIFCTPDQLHTEILDIMNFVSDVMNMFGFEFIHTLSTRPEEGYIGSIEIWDKATAALEDALKAQGVPYTINEGDGAFYGPKIDIKLKDAIGRYWQCATIQCDLNLPERFDISYIGEDGQKHRPIMLHRVIMGSVDRFIGVLIEHFAGSFPFWLAPEQIRVMNITSDQEDYARDIAKKLKMAGYRVDMDLRNEKIGFKIREAQMMKVPHMLVLGNAEKDEAKISVRLRDGETRNGITLADYMDAIAKLNSTRSLALWA